MSENEDPPVQQVQAGLNAHEDARAVVRLLQCSHCSYPLREPMTLPCGSSLCRPCLPPLYKRENITYPISEGRSEGFVCPFKDCGLEHSMGDCSTDVTLNKVMELVKTHIAQYKAETSDATIQLDEVLNMQNIANSSIDVMPRTRVLHGGRLVATYIFADMGELNYHSDVKYTPLNAGTADSTEALDIAVLQNLKEVVRNELECQVCYAVMLDPLTTSCGHTFCRRCVARVLDHSNLCPICRRMLPLAPGVQGEPSNKKITYIVQSLLTEALAARVTAIEQEDAIDEDANMPLFPCTLAFPLMPTFLHIFEPRYRLMIRRCVENGTRKFGMMMYNNLQIPQANLGRVHFMQYGTILHIERVEMLSDGRSLIETRGMSRFRVLEASMFDGYAVGHIQRIEDIPISEEEAAEARETGRDRSDEDDPMAEIESMSTQRLLEFGLEFIEKARARSARWLHQRVLAAYGQPPTDPALFPYWLASVLPIIDDEKYLLLPTTSVRERLKITARWIKRLEAAQCESEARERAARAAAVAAVQAAALRAAQARAEDTDEEHDPTSETTEQDEETAEEVAEPDNSNANTPQASTADNNEGPDSGNVNNNTADSTQHSTPDDNQDQRQQGTAETSESAEISSATDLPVAHIPEQEHEQERPEH